MGLTGGRLTTIFDIVFIDFFFLHLKRKNIENSNQRLLDKLPENLTDKTFLNFTTPKRKFHQLSTIKLLWFLLKFSHKNILDGNFCV